MSCIVAFYLGQAPDDHGRTIDDLWGFDDDQLEDVHDYVQRLFPARRPSQFERAALLDDETEKAFRESPELRERLLKSFDLMLRFYGLRREAGEVVPAANFEARAIDWLTGHNHNFLRITRILLCLKALGLPEWAFAFFRRLKAIHEARPGAVNAESFRFWRTAVEAKD